MDNNILKWLPTGKKAAICFSVDDIHPQTSSGYYEGGGDCNNGQLGLLQWLINRHKQLMITLFVTADWREISHIPTNKILARIPFLRDKFYLSKRLPPHSMQIDKYKDFVNFLNDNPNFEIALHGLHHCHKGLTIPVEFQDETEEELDIIICKIIEIFDNSKINYVKGICPPCWNAPDNLLKVLVKHNINFISSSRDLNTKISYDAITNMSGLIGEPLIHPSLIYNGKLVHIPINFQATSNIDRAIQIIENNGLLSIKAHIIKNASLDAVGYLYMNYLDVLFSTIEEKYGENIWWTSMGEISKHVLCK